MLIRLLLAASLFCTPGVATTASASNVKAPVPDIAVNTTDDELNSDGDCSLREAIEAANTNLQVDQCAAGTEGLPADTIGVPAGTYTLLPDASGFGSLTVTDDLELTGAGAGNTIIAGDTGFDDRIIKTAFATARTFTLARVTVTGGLGGIKIDSNTTATISNCVVEDNDTLGQGGGISVRGTLILERATIADNGAKSGGGVDCLECDLTIRDSAIIANRADTGICAPAALTKAGGGGLRVSSYYNASALADLYNVTISGNSTSCQGGGIFVTSEELGFEDGTTSVNLKNVTVTNNEADDGGGVYIDGFLSELTADNSIFAANLEEDVLNDGPDCEADLLRFTSNGYNLSGKGGGCDFDGWGDIALPGSSIVDPGLAPLADNGGFTQTHALLFTSPAIDAGNPGTPGAGSDNCLAEDQRGMARPYNSRCDIGAFEYHAEDPTITLSETGDPPPDEYIGGSGASLREAIIAANALPGSQTINLPAGNYKLTLVGASEDECLTGDLDILDGLTLQGEGTASTYIDPAPSWDDRVFELNTDQTVHVEGLTVQGGSTDADGGAFRVSGGAHLELDRVALADSSADRGAGMFVTDSSADLTDCTVRDNTASSFGGGIYLDGRSTVHLERSTVGGNDCDGDGGGIVFAGISLGLMTLTNSTISGNTCTGRGGGIYVIDADGQMHISSSTVVDNACGTGNGGGVFNLGSDVYLRNSIVAVNSDPSAAPFAPDLAGAIISRDFNLIGILNANASLSGDIAGNQTGTEASPLLPHLGILQYNGGLTRNHNLLADSPALEAGNLAGCLDHDDRPILDDQRSAPRPTGMRCDIGSVEGDFDLVRCDRDSDCDDGVFCTEDACDTRTGICESVPRHGLCRNDLFCDGSETCDPVKDCQKGKAVDCDDDVSCTVDACNEASDSCDNRPGNGLCDNGLFCDGTETCDPVDDCQAGTAVDCFPLVCHENSDSCLEGEIFADGFESGNTSAWSASVP